MPVSQVYAPFIAAGKAVVDAEFEVANLDLCNSTEAESIDFIVKVKRSRMFIYLFFFFCLLIFYFGLCSGGWAGILISDDSMMAP